MRVLILTAAFVGAAAAAFLISRPNAEPEKEKRKEKPIEKGKTVGDLAHELEEAWSDHHTLVA